MNIVITAGVKNIDCTITVIIGTAINIRIVSYHYRRSKYCD
ncbi:hypothetical protein YPPY54_1698 [Yersinia pestis PY-54]|nr:hypothetical protein YpUG050454_2285 [Yersinia pestis biovar Antiqua str. UG05-0454]EIS30574.1 hypothetical protein YPPY54_1698 [Yersinia pestis PY-54]EIS98480.1 hypothetical protein YPPY89_1820 [Yersinia pestis PY-89]